MDTGKLHDWLQIAALFGVIGSLVFVGLEMQQARQIAIADIYQQRTAMAIDVQTAQYSPEQYRPVLDKIASGQQLSTEEMRLLQYTNNPWLSYAENVHFQFQLGLLSEEQWESSRNSLRQRVSFSQFQDFWSRERSSWRASFAQEIDKLIAEEKAKAGDL